MRQGGARPDAPREPRRSDFERTLVAFSSRFVGTLGLDEAIHAGLADLSRLSGASRAYLFLLRPGGVLMDNTHEWCAPGVAPHVDQLQGLRCDDFPWWMERLRGGEAIHVRDVSAMPPEAAAEKAILEAQDIKSALVFPVRVAGELAGFVGFDDVRQAARWRDEDLRLLDVAADILGNALQRQEAERRLRMSETRFRLLVEQSPLSVQILAPDGRTVEVNAAWERLWGVTLDDIPGYNVLLDPQLREKGVTPYLERAFAGEPVVVPPAGYAPDRGPMRGREIWVRAVAYPVKDERGAVREVVLIHEDTTEQRQAEIELAASRHQLAVSEKLSALGALVSGVAHEVRTPLTYVANHLALLDAAARRAEGGRVEAGKVAEHVSAAMDGMERINALVEDLRGYARVPTGRRVRSDLAEVVRPAVHLFRATHRGQVLVEDALQATPHVEVAPEHVQQVALNLLHNASEAMGGKGRVRVATRPAPGGAELVVEDEGPGLSEEAAARLFEPFFTTKPEGTGLGLSISRRLVQAQRGAIRHEPRDGGGARFVVFLPAAPEGSGDAAP